MSLKFRIFSRLKNMDQFIKVYDLRMYKALSPIGMPYLPQFARFMPSYCERVCVTYQTMYNQPGQTATWSNHPAGVKMFDLNSNGNSAEFPIETSLISAFDFSSNKNFIAVGNHCGMLFRMRLKNIISPLGIVNVFADRDQPQVNENSKETVFAAPPV